MLQRTITALIATPLFILCIYIGGEILAILLTAISCIGFYEFTKAINKDFDIGSLITICIIPIAFLTSYLGRNEYLIILLSLVVVANMINVIVKFPESKISDSSVNTFTFLYLTIVFILIFKIREVENGFMLVLGLFIASITSDTAAYLVGKNFGKNKLVPILSPNKTVEGAIGAVIATALALALYAYLLFDVIEFNFNEYIFYFAFFIFGAFISIFAQLGDLFASAVKRQVNIKDYGNLLPGHGGIIDRFDSILMITPFFYTLYVLLNLI